MKCCILLIAVGLAFLSKAEGTGGGCPLGFIPYRKSCYWFSHIRGTFAEAGFMCQYMKSHLAVVKNRGVDSFLRGHLLRHSKGTEYFVGGTDLRLEGRFTWRGEQRPISYANWSPGEPNNHKGINHCIALRRPTYRWDDYPCGRQNNFICECKRQ